MKKQVSVLMAFSLCLLASSQLQVSAADVEAPPTVSTTESDVSLLTEGLIRQYDVSCSGGNKTLYLSARIRGFSTMGELGFKDIIVQRSLDNRNWTKETTLDDMIADDTDYYSVDSYAISVEGGYYYRVKLNPYAKEQTWFFPDTQTEVDTSNSVWIP